MHVPRFPARHPAGCYGQTVRSARFGQSARGRRQQLTRLDVAVQAGALAQKAPAQRGIVGDQGDELIQADKQLTNQRMNGLRT